MPLVRNDDDTLQEFDTPRDTAKLAWAEVHLISAIVDYVELRGHLAARAVVPEILRLYEDGSSMSEIQYILSMDRQHRE